MSLRLFTLGSFRVQNNETPLSDAAWKTQKNKTLLQLLITFRKRPLTREQIIEFLWANQAPAAADRNLRVAISQLRQALKTTETNAPILTTEHGYAWNPDAAAWLDADEFEWLSAQSEATPADAILAERARQLYRGDYLEQERYADWATAERERLRELYFALLTRMADAYARRGQYRRAIALAREILAADRVRESVWCQLMLYHYHAGDPALALRAFDECGAALAQELDAEPLAETIDLAEQIRRRRVRGEKYPPPPALERLRELPVSLGRTMFVGREREWAALVNVWNAVNAGTGRAILIQGEAGVGKTRLADELAMYARHQGARMLEGKGRELLSGALPAQPLIDALRSAPEAQGAALALDPLWRVELARLVPEWNPIPGDTSTRGGDPSRLFEAVTRLVFQIARDAALILFLDDAQWLDETTIHCLAYVSQRLGTQRVLFLLTARFDEVTPSSALAVWFNEMQRAGLLQRITLAPLSREATMELVDKASHASPRASEMAAQLHHETQGYPLFLVALLQAHFEDGLLYADETGQWLGAENVLARGDVSAVPETIHAILSQRVRRLDTRVQRLLNMAAVLGRPFEGAWMQAVLGDATAAVLDDLDQALERNLLRVTESPRRTAYDLTHDLLRRVIYNALSPERRTRAHRQVLAALETTTAQDGENTAELAHHARWGRLWHQAVQYSIRAADAALERYAMQEAARQCEQGLDALAALKASGEKLVPNASEGMDARQHLLWRYDLLAAQQLANHLLGARDAASLEQLLTLARELNDPERLAKAYYALMRYHIDTGQNDAALELVPLYEPLVAQGVSPHTAMGFYQRVGFLYYRTGDFERAQFYHDEALRLARDAGDAHWQAYVLNTRGTVLMCLGRYQDAIADFTDAAALWESSTRHMFRAFALDNRADVLYYLGQYETALATKQAALARYREFGYPIAEAECLCEIGFSLRELGRAAEAETFLNQGLELSERLGDSFDLVQSLNGLAVLYLHEDARAQRRDVSVERLYTAVEYAVRAVSEGERAHLPHAVIQGLAYGALAQLKLGRAADALELSARAISLLEERQHIEGAEEEIYFIHSRVLAALGRAADAKAALERAFTEMMTKADALTDAELRTSFLERVRVNRAILASPPSPLSRK